MRMHAEKDGDFLCRRADEHAWCTPHPSTRDTANECCVKVKRLINLFVVGTKTWCCVHRRRSTCIRRVGHEQWSPHYTILLRKQVVYLQHNLHQRTSTAHLARHHGTRSILSTLSCRPIHRLTPKNTILLM